jgi:tetratricopeptide (TPR) repeat protein
MTASHDSETSRFNVLTGRVSKGSTITASVCLGLTALTLLCYWPVLSHKFVCFDDEHYLFDSGYVSKGLTWPGTVWALRTGYFANWHPLTWLSFMLDAQIYGMSPRGFHLTNLLFHIANSLLLFLLLKCMTQRFWPSAITAALFAWHPLHVESVAWVSERKDVLSTFFFLLTLFSFWRYVKERESTTPVPDRVSRFYLLSLLFFMLALMSKQMVVTLPCILLLLDIWPLRRIALEVSKWRDLISRGLVLLREKLPFFALAFAASAVIFAVQNAGGAVSSVENNPLRYRIANALFGYVAYLADTFWPIHLSAVYPVWYKYSFVGISGAALLLAGISALVVYRARQNPFLPVGWFWFAGTLVPVIGLIQVGAQSRADRYMYVPSIGLSIALIWGIDALFQLLGRGRMEAEILPPDTGASPGSLCRPQRFWNLTEWCSSRRAPFLVLASGTVLAACLFCTRRQAGYWHDSETLFRHAIALAPDNYMAYNCLGRALEELDRKDEAIQCLREAVRLAPGYAGGQYNLGTMLLLQNKIEEALSHLKVAVKESPKDPNGHQNLGHVYFLQGKLPEAIAEYAESVALDPENGPFRIVLGMALLKQSRWTDAEIVLAEAVRLDPANAEANRNLGLALLNQRKHDEAIRYFSEAIRLQPSKTESRFNLGLALLAKNQPAQAAEQFAECVRMNPSEARGHYLQAVSLSKLHHLKDAIFHYREALRLNPDFADALDGLAHLLACSSDADVRDGVEAVELAEKACAITEYQQANMLSTLAAAYAEAGRFQDAITAAQRACNLAAASGQSALEAKAGELLELCQSARPLRE